MSEHLSNWHEQFPPPSLSDWEAQIVKTLKGRTAEELQWMPEPGIELSAYYSDAEKHLPKSWTENRPGSFPFLRGSGQTQTGDPWQLVQTVNLNEAKSKRRIAEAKASDVQALKLTGESASVDIWNQIDLQQLAIHLAVDAAPILSTTDLKLACSLQGMKPEFLTGTLLNDPISAAAAKGKVVGDAGWIACEGGITNMDPSPYFRSLGLDLSYVRLAGGAVTHELAFALGTIVEYLDQLSRMGHTIEYLLANLAINFATGNRFFLELAKFRAFRILLANLTAAYQVAEPFQTCFVMASSTGRDKAIDMPNHLIQLTTQSISAILGGADGIIAEAGENGGESRLARNVQYLLRHESQLHLVQDPAGGAHYIDILTHQLVQESWELFQTMEASGGFLANIKNGRVPGLMEAYRRLEEERQG